MAATSDSLPPSGVFNPLDISPSAKRRPRYLFNRWVDFLALGGGSVFILGALAVFFPRDDESRIALAAAMLIVVHFVNYSHTVNSYQLFYKDFIKKAFFPESTLRHRYRFAGTG